MLRRVIYTTNSIESLNYQLRKIIKNRGHFPNDDAVIKQTAVAGHLHHRRQTSPEPAPKRPASAAAPNAKPTGTSSKAKPPPAGNKPSPNSPSSTPTESTPTYDQNQLPYTKDLTGSDVSVTVRQDATVKAAIARIAEQAWIPIEYPDAVFDEPSGR